MNLNEYFLRVRNGDKTAFTQIYHELKKPVFTIACRIVRSRETAEDITQEVFVRLFLSPPEPSVKNPRAWIFQMVHNLAVDALRKKHSTDMMEEREMSDTMGDVELRMDLEAAIGRLMDCEREILSLHLNGGLHFNEISEIVGLSVPSVYRRYRKALKILRNELNGGAL